MNQPRTTLLITLTGRDRPGVTSRLFGALARFPLSVADIEQVTIRGKLVLGVLVELHEPPDLTAIYGAVTDLAADLGLEAEITTGSAESPARAGPPGCAAGCTSPCSAARSSRARWRPWRAGSPPTAPTSTGSPGWPATR